MLSGPPERSAHEAMVATTGLAPEPFDKHYWKHRPAYDKGQFHGDGFWRAFAQSAEIDLTDSQIEHLIRHDVTMWTDADAAMLDWAWRLREAGFLVAILSNMVKEIREHMEHLEWLATFQNNTWSYELGISKPNVAIYRHALQKLGVLPNEALFIDDIAENIRAAEVVGLNAVLFTTPAQLQIDLTSRIFASQLPFVISSR